MKRIHIVTNPSYTVPINEHGLDRTPSMLLIPFEFYSAYKQRLRELKMNTRQYLGYLVSNYRHLVFSGFFDHLKRVKFEYQRHNLDLQCVRFRPDNKDWAELKNFGGFLGMSLCKVFVVLLEYDLKGITTVIVETETNVDLTTMAFGESGVEFAQNVVYYKDRVEVQRIIRLQKPCYDYGLLLEENLE